MPGSAEMIFDVASDLGRADSWMPRELHLRPEDPPAVAVHKDRTGEDRAALIRADRERLRLEWGTRETDSYAGWLQIAANEPGSGTSEVTAHLSFFDEHADPGAGLVETGLDLTIYRNIHITQRATP